MLITHAWPRSGKITVDPDCAEIAPEVSVRVDALWEDEKRRWPGLHNGLLYSVTALTDGKLVVRPEEYKNFIAQQRDPTLARILTVQPLAVSGVVECREGIVFGRRSQSNTTDRGAWELVPSGTVDNDPPDPVAQVLQELSEEIGLDGRAVVEVQPFSIIEDRDSGVVDIGCDIQVSVTESALYEAHKNTASQEYDVIRVVPVPDLNAFVTEADGVVEVSRALLHIKGYLGSR